MATTDRPCRASHWQEGVDDARAGQAPRPYTSLPMSADGWANAKTRRGYMNGYRYGQNNPKKNESAQ